MTGQASADIDAARMELQEAIATVRQQMTLSVQIGGTIAAADALLLGYGFAQHQAAIFLVASFMPIILAVIGVIVLRAIIPIGCVALILEHQLRLRTAPLAGAFLFSILRGYAPANLDLSVSTAEDLQKSLSSGSTRTLLTSKPAFLLYAVSILQMGLFFAATFAAGFRFM